jgi:RNA polymerase sigma-70 factor (ECF subfamily)
MVENMVWRVRPMVTDYEAASPRHPGTGRSGPPRGLPPNRHIQKLNARRLPDSSILDEVAAMRIAAESTLVVSRTSADSQKPSPLEQEVVDLFDRFRVRLLRYTFGFGLSVQDSEEIVQEVFLALFQHLQRGKSRENLQGWVFRVAHNLALKRRAAIGNTGGSAAGSAGRLAAIGRDEDSDSLADPAPNPEDQVASNQIQRRLLAVFRALPEQDRQCLTLRAEGLRYREIGQALGVSLGAVSQSLSRSLARLTNAAER